MVASLNQKTKTNETSSGPAYGPSSCYYPMPLYGQLYKNLLGKEVRMMRKGLVVLMTTGLVLTAGSGIALAIQENNDGSTPYSSPGSGGGSTVNPTDPKGNIRSNEYTPIGHDGAVKDYQYYEEGSAVSSGSYSGSTPSGVYAKSTHWYGTWNSPYTAGVDGYNYNDAQDYVDGGDQVDGVYQSGPHGGYKTSTHRCRECHAVHRAAGKFKLLRSDSRFEACDWCHGTGAGSGYNIQMDNDDNYTTEYNVGHTMGFGISTGKWKAPDDTYPAFTPNYWMGGFSCFDCHSPHANPQRMLGYNSDGVAVGITGLNDGKVYGIVNSGGDDWDNALKKDNNPQGTNKPFWLSGSWLLIKNPDRELASKDTTVSSGILTLGGTAMSDITFDSQDQPVLDSEIPEVVFKAGQEIPDYVTAGLNEFSDTTAYPVNKIAIDWDSPMGNARTLWKRAGGGVTAEYSYSTGEAIGFLGFNIRRSEAIREWEETAAGADKFTEKYTTDATNSEGKAFRTDTPCNVWSVSDFCTDCHDGNAGKHTVAAPLFSEDRALRDQGSSGDSPAWSGNYDVAYGHDVQPRH